MTAKKLADMLADAIDEDWCDSDDEHFKALRMTPSIVGKRHFLGIESSTGQAFLITFEEV